MLSKKFFIIAISLFLTCSFFANSQIIHTENKTISTTDIDFAEMPNWTIGNSWKYNMDFDFIAREGSSITFSVNAVIENMYAVLTSIENIGADESYVLTLDGDIRGKLSLFNAEIEIADFNGDFWGDAYIGKNTLGIKRFEFEVDGQVSLPIIGWRHMYFNMIMGFEECFDFFDFPIYVDEPSWDVHIEEATLHAEVDVDIPFGETDYSGSMMFNDVMSVKGTENVQVPAGSYDSIIIGGTWGYLSDLWYAPDVGYLVKLDEGLNWEDGLIESVFHLTLVETNYDISNDPPLPPDQPYGDQTGEAETEYYYETQGIDPNCDQIYYLFDWGDGDSSGWIGPYTSGTTISASHIWHDKGTYNVKVKTKDASGIEGDWSKPLSVLIQGYPDVKVTVYKIEQIDEIDVGNEPELYYTVAAISQGISSPPQIAYNTDDGTYEGVWAENSSWMPEKDHIFKGYSRNVTINLKLMDQDDRWEDPVYDADDLADVSGCSGGGVDNNVFPPVGQLRGATYYGTYDVVEKELKQYQTGAASENADYVYKQDGYYITSGDHQPDSSNSDDQNDAEIWFELSSDYRSPRADAILLNQNGEIRPNQKLNFNAISQYGVPDYSWLWDFGDGETSTEQNPMHVYTTSGTYSVKLTVTDGFGEQNTDTIELNIENNNPILSKDKVAWTGKGGVDDTFTFSVHYIDSDGDNPLIKNVVIDGDSYLMNGFGSNTDFTLSVLGEEFGKGIHKYYFQFEDGYGGSVTTTEKSFQVAKAKALSNQYPLRLRELIDHFPIFEKIFTFFSI